MPNDSNKFFEKLLDWSAFSDKHPRVVAITGSTKYEDAFRSAAESETAMGHIVLMPHIFRHNERWRAHGVSEEVGAALDCLFQYAIRMADELLVVNENGYIGEGTQRDIDKAKERGITIRFTNIVKPEDVKHCFNPNCNSRKTDMQYNGDVYWRLCNECGSCGPSACNEYAADTGWNSILRYGDGK